MPRVSNLIFISLEGITPEELGLAPLATAQSTFSTVVSALAPFTETNSSPIFVRDLSKLATQVQPCNEEITVVYVMGHGWKTNKGYFVAALENRETLFLAGTELLKRITPLLAGPTLLFIDTCNAAALLSTVQDLAFPNLTCITASDDNESATEFSLDRSTRFALTLRACLNKAKRPDDVDVVQLATQMREQLRRPTLVPPQTVDYWSSGRLLRLSWNNTQANISPYRRSRTHLFLRALFLILGIAISAAGVTSFFYYRNHVYVQLFAGPLNSMDGRVQLEIHAQQTDTNQDRLLESRDLYRNGVTRLKLPATDLILIVKTHYTDGQPREIRFPIFAASGLSYTDKRSDFQLPSDDEIGAHAGMAYISKMRWLQGPDRIQTYNPQDFWIDLKPVTTEEYLPIASQLVSERKLEPFLSQLLTDEQQAEAVKSTNLKQIPELMGQLQNVFDVITAESRATRHPQGSNARALPTARLACPTCPAKLTIEEARLFCEVRHKRLPTDLEWELAARGVDARLYPWGNAFDKSRANVVELPDKGQKYDLVPVDAFESGRSPFGLLDTVGNAGDWVDSRGGYEKTFMGGTYRFDRESTLTYSAMPDTGDPFPQMPVTCRCVSVH